MRPPTLAIAIAFLCLCSAGCTRDRRVAAEAPPLTYQAPSAQSDVQKLPKIPAKPNEVEAAVKRVFKDAVVISSQHEPNFVAGDFNGDDSQDIAVVIKPAAGKLAELNAEYPAWMLKDPFMPQPTASALRVEENETLLVIIHGYGLNDWRDPQATQTFVLKNVVGSALRVQPAKEFVAANDGKNLPRFHGDLINETLRGANGCVYYASMAYRWYDAKTYKPEAEGRLVHMGTQRRESATIKIPEVKR